ncbi:hypothetical protein [Streptomyces sp. NPDC018693]|uniref:hypothetical protein n=1 Tax=unclassified Streptomyces TaxID=2593676 RepID=UPI00379BA2FB
MADRWPPTELFGLHIDSGRNSDGRRVHLPTATLTCRHGCHHRAVGVKEVAHFTAHITASHARSCPGQPTTKENSRA